jgi:hypothetical protein
MKKIILVLALTIIMFNMVHAEPERYLYTDIIEEEGNFIDVNFFVIEQTIYYSDFMYSGAALDDSDYVLNIYDILGNIIFTREANYFSNNKVNFTENFHRVEITRDGSIVFEKVISFCNQDNICESCQNGNCALIENSISCSDCKTGSQDYYCDLVQDGICDPDCNDVDGDCSSCDDTCFYRYENIEKMVSEKKDESEKINFTVEEENNILENELESEKNSIEDEKEKELIQEEMKNEDDLESKNNLENIEKESETVVENTNNMKNEIKTNSNTVSIIIIIFIVVVIMIGLIFLMKKKKDSDEENNINKNNNSGINNNGSTEDLEKGQDEDQVSLEEQYRRNNYGNQYNKK